MIKIWNSLFLEERSSIVLSLFRIAVAWTVIAVVVPSFFHLNDTFLSTAFKEYNTQFFPLSIVQWVQGSPEWLIYGFVWLFLFSACMFFVGLLTQISCIVVTICCYYFYALNAFAVGTLSWDILLVTLVLMCMTSYPGDYFSIDSMLKKNPDAYKTSRPYFIQRLLQIQIAVTFLMTGLHKITVEGNWLTDNPIFYLMNAPVQGVVKNFLLKDVLRHLPEVCYAIGIVIVVVEILMPFLLFWRRTRVTAVFLGLFFHVLLLLTLDVPATFFFVFPAQLLLFINPQKVVAWIEEKQAFYAQAPRSQLLYDGSCIFCQHSVNALQVLDVFRNVALVDVSSLHVERLKELHPDLTEEAVKKQLHLIKPSGALSGGFFVFRSLCWVMPLMTPWAIVFYFPLSGWMGPIIYRFVAKYRYLILGKRGCANDACAL